MKIFISVFLVTLCGCQTIMEEHKRQMAVLCTYEGAYSKGAEHAENQEGSKASVTFALCGAQAKEEALRGYNDGYASYSESSSQGSIRPVLSSYVCEIEVFTEKFSEKGRSRAEALHNTKTTCSNSRHDGDFFCSKTSDYNCKKLF